MNRHCCPSKGINIQEIDIMAMNKRMIARQLLAMADELEKTEKLDNSAINASRRRKASGESAYDSFSYEDWEFYTDVRIQEIAAHLRIERQCLDAVLNYIQKNPGVYDNKIEKIKKNRANLINAIKILESSFG